MMMQKEIQVPKETNVKEYAKIKANQANQLGSVDNVHPMKQVAVMSVVQVVMLAGMVYAMFLIGQYV